MPGLYSMLQTCEFFFHEDQIEQVTDFSTSWSLWDLLIVATGVAFLITRKSVTMCGFVT